MDKQRKLIENAYVVRDLDKALAFWTTAGQAGPFFCSEADIPAERHVFRGRNARLRTRFAFGAVGDIVIELVQQVMDGPSIFTEALAKRGEGLHHLKYAVPNRRAEVERLVAAGFTEVAEIWVTESRCISFVDTYDTAGAFLEVMDYADFAPVFEAYLRAHAAWDGKTDPIRPWSRLAEYQQ